MTYGTFKDVQSQNIKVGDIVKVCHSQRVPADMILLKSTDKTGGVFIKTDQLDGETDWKFRESIQQLQGVTDLTHFRDSQIEIYVNPPEKEINDFKGYYQMYPGAPKEGLSLKHTLWTNTIVASQGHILALAIYTGKESRYKMNT